MGKPAVAVDFDPMLEALANAPVDPTILSADELAELDAQMAASSGETTTLADARAAVAERAAREG